MNPQEIEELAASETLIPRQSGKLSQVVAKLEHSAAVEADSNYSELTKDAQETLTARREADKPKDTVHFENTRYKKPQRKYKRREIVLGIYRTFKKHGIGMNSPCPCGRGPKFKHCCKIALEDKNIAIKGIMQRLGMKMKVPGL